MKQVIGATAGFFIGGPAGALQGFAAGQAWDSADKQKKAAKQASASQARVETGQRRQMADASAERNKLLQEGSRITRRRGPLTSYAGAA